MADDGSTYIHGTDPDEQRRLGLMNTILNAASLRELRLLGGEKILELGSGLGQFARLMARTAGAGGRVVGIERSAAQRAEAVRQAREDGEETLVEFRAGDALALSLGDGERGTFDIAHTRFLLEHVQRPLEVVRAMVRAVCPGGRIVLEDDDHDLLRLWPEPPGFRNLWSLYAGTYTKLGNDPHVGRRLVTLLHDAGAVPSRNTWLFFGACSGDPLFPIVVENMAGVVSSARDAVLAAGTVGRAEFDATLGTFAAWGRRPDAALWYAVCWAEGKRPERDLSAAT